MLYRPPKGKIWDPTVIIIGKTYYLFTMYYEENCPESYAMRLATSPDGVHWEDQGCPITDPTYPIWKMGIHRTAKGLFGLNHGSMSLTPGHGNDTLRYFVSDDLRNWKFLTSDHPDPRWYESAERWDHMYAIPSEKGGYIGYVVATPKPEIGGMIGIQRSEDGLLWHACPPPVIEWEGCEPVREMEVGGCEKIDGRYYLIGGICPPFEGNYAYSCYTFVADSEDGPFRPDKEALRLCGFNGRKNALFVQALAAFCHNYDAPDEHLVSNSLVYDLDQSGNNTWMLPLKRAVTDSDGHLRLAYFEKNDALKGAGLPHEPACHIVSEASTGYQLNDAWQSAVIGQITPAKGAFIEGKLRIDPFPGRGPVRAGCWRPTFAGFQIDETNSDKETAAGTALLMECTQSRHRHTYIGSLDFTRDDPFIPEDIIAPGCACPTGITPGVEHDFRLLIRHGMFEFYLDGLHVQSYTTAQHPNGMIRAVVCNGDLHIYQLDIHQMNL